MVGKAASTTSPMFDVLELNRGLWLESRRLAVHKQTDTKLVSILSSTDMYIGVAQHKHDYWFGLVELNFGLVLK